MKSRWIQKIIIFAKKTYVHRLKSLKLELMGQKEYMSFGVSEYIAKPPCRVFFICKLLCICSTIQNFNSQKMFNYLIHTSFTRPPWISLSRWPSHPSFGVITIPYTHFYISLAILCLIYIYMLVASCFLSF